MKLARLVLGLYLAIAILAVSGAFPIAIDNSFYFGKSHLWQSTAHGAKVALIIGTIAAGTAVSIGTVLGFISAWYGGVISAVILWLATSVAAIPGILLALVLSYGMGGGIAAVFFSIGLVSWVEVYKLVHAEVLNLQGQAHVEAARGIGAKVSTIALRHILPCLKPLLATQFQLLFIFSVKAETVLSFLGVGLHQQASWGRMLADAWAFGDLTNGNYARITIASLSLAILILALQKYTSCRQK
ncbi:MAG: ABC transporter permease [Planctomycetes bacterium]|nr:ABC transporter permease [Planctomycetota bacterium]